MDKIRLWALTIVALGFLANCAVRPSAARRYDARTQAHPGHPG